MSRKMFFGLVLGLLMLLGVMPLMCLPVNAQRVTIFTENFEGLWPNPAYWYVYDDNPNSGLDYWAKAPMRYGGSWGAWCNGYPTPIVTNYDDNMDTHMYRSGLSLSGYSNVQLFYHYYLRCDPYSTADRLQVMYRVGMGTWYYVDMKYGDLGNSWYSSTVSIPNTATAVGFHFISDSAISYNVGAFVDDIVLSGDPIQPSGGYTVISPNGGESWARGTTHAITWTWTGSPGANVYVDLLKSGVLVWWTSHPNDGHYTWTIPSTLTPGTDYKIRIQSTSNLAIQDSSNSNFAIDGATITVTSPNGGESWVRGRTYTIRWTSTGSPCTSVHIELLKNGVYVRTLATHPNDGAISWTIPSTQTLGTNYQIRVHCSSNTAITDSSNSNFAIVASTAGTLTVTSPNGGQSWKRGTTHTITWSKSGTTGSYVKIELLKSGVVNRVITSSTPNDGSYSWTIPSTQTPGTDYKIRITSTTYSSITDSSNSNFYITT